MKPMTIRKSDLGEFVDILRERAEVYAPVEREGRVVLDALGDGEQPHLGPGNASMSPKSVFFPQMEVLCKFKDDELSEAPVPADRRVVIFGVRPCDTRAIAGMDKIFGEFGGRTDPYYQARRENSVIVALACAAPCETCFCTSVGGDPAGIEGADILATPLDDAFLLEALNKKGEALLEDCASLLRPATGPELEQREAVVAAAREALPAMDLEALRERLEQDFDSPLWDEIAEVCLGCGLCTYQCPTCYCFDITDEKKGHEGKRMRTWDSCQYALFTMHASGHNPRTLKTQRMRQRIMHKFLYAYDSVGNVFCAGCGRCVEHCPVNLDIREALRKLRDEHTARTDPK